MIQTTTIPYASVVTVFGPRPMGRQMDFTDSDLRVYAVEGTFAVVVYLVALAVLVVATDLELTVRTTATLSGGFLLFMGSYVVAMVVYRQVKSREDGA